MDWIRSIVKLAIVVIGLVLIYLGLSSVIRSTNHDIAKARTNNASAYIVNSYISATPFGPSTNVVTPGEQIFYNIQIERHAGAACFVQTSWRWVLHLPTGNSVMWNTDDGQFYAGDKTESLAQAISVPATLLAGDYTLSRLSVFMCGDTDVYARTVRNIDLHVNDRLTDKTTSSK